MSGLRVLVVGAGALGNEVLKNLALLGVGSIRIIDRDRVERSNLTRSVLYCTPHVEEHIRRGTPKAELASSRLREINPDVEVEALVGEIGDLGLGRIRRIDLVFSCLDNEMARLELSRACLRLGKPLVDGGLGLINYSSGLVSIFPGREGPCYLCRKGAGRRRELMQELFGREDPCWAKNREAGEQDTVATTPLMASLVAAVQVEHGLRHVFSEVVESTSGWSCRIDLHPRVRMEEFTFRPSPHCPLHEEENLIREVVELDGKDSEHWTPAGILNLVEGAQSLCLDWPVTARALCRSCGHAWEPLVRRALFRNRPCPTCGSGPVAETEVLTRIDFDSEWASRTLAELRLPRGHVFEVARGNELEPPRIHVEISGDLV